MPELTESLVATDGDSRNRALIEAFLARRNDLRPIVSKIVGSPDLADDVLQDAYLKLEHGICARDVANPFGYCCQVVRNMALDYLRRRAVEAACMVNSSDGALPEVAGGASAEAGIDERRMLVRVEAALAALPPRTRRAFELYRLEGLTQRQIAQILGVSATLVNFMIKDAMTALAACREPPEG
jgi:RNA polymerase sigma-70 factor (ECF subfamily)